MNRGKSFKSDLNQSVTGFRVAVLGNGTSAPTVPANGSFRPGTSTFPSGLNSVSFLAAEAPTRSGAGIYVVTVQHALVNAWPVSAVVLKGGSSPTTVMEATPTIYDPATRQLTVKTFVPNGTATDIGTSDMLIVSFEGQDSSVT